MARFLLTPFGSAGDVNPMLWLGRLLQQRGHEVTVITTPLFRDVTQKAGLEFVGVGDEDRYLEALKDPKLWKPLAGTALVLQLTIETLRPFYNEMAKRIPGADTVIVAPLHVFAARAVREKFNVPLVTMHLQPMAMLSAYDPLVIFPGAEWMARVPVWMKRLAFRLPNPVNRQVSRPLRSFCAEIGIAPPRKVIPEWMHSPDGSLLLFPEWFAPRRPDWQENAHAAGFPLEDLQGQFGLPPDLAAFLAEGEPPVLLSPGTGNAQGREFFAAGLEACRRMGRRALAGTRFPEQLRQPLPSFARQFDYLPFGTLLPRVAALIHHGGIGTMSQAFAAGVPQLIMPMGHDQPDNAYRAKQLGVAEDIAPGKFTPENIERALRRLLGSEAVAQACQRVATRIRADRPAGKALEVLEGVIRSR